jgi:hypothetical protein
MIKVDPIARESIDAWPIARSGLPRRVVNGLSRIGVKTVGELRSMAPEELKSTRNIGAGSVRDIRTFFSLCRAIEEGRLAFSDIVELLKTFLSGPRLDALTLRYGLRDAPGQVKRGAATLQAIGNKYGFSRERARQVESLAMGALGCHLAMSCLAPVRSVFLGFIAQRCGVVGAEELEVLQGHPVIQPYSPAGLLLLLTDLDDGVCFHDGIFSTLPAPRLREAARALMGHLREHGGLSPLDELAQVVPQGHWAGDPAARGDPPAAADHLQILRCILLHSPRVRCTTDDRFHVTESGARQLLLEAMQRLPQPSHFRAILREFNSAMRPGSRLGAGRLLNMLLDEPSIERVSSGHYQVNVTHATR